MLQNTALCSILTYEDGVMTVGGGGGGGGEAKLCTFVPPPERIFSSIRARKTHTARSRTLMSTRRNAKRIFKRFFPR